MICLMAAPAVNLLPLTVALFLLGLGWNFGYIGGTTMLTETYEPEEKNKAQGLNDFLVFTTTAVT